MKNISVKTILKASQARSHRDWERVLLSIDIEVLKAFKRVCKRHGIKHSVAVEEFMREFGKL